VGADVKLSVRVITYNQAPFVAQALDGALAQRVDFPCEIVVGDDGSTDGTREIVLDYQRRYPERLRVLTSEHNRGGRWNFVRTLEACRGEYIALLDGDDHWTAPDKLARQVAFLDRRPDHAICFHDVLVTYEDGRCPAHRHCDADQRATTGLRKLLREDFIATSSAVLRRQPWQFPDWFHAAPAGDWPLLIMTAARGLIGYLPDVMGAYRIHGRGLSQGFASAPGRRERYLRGTAAMLRAVGAHLGERYGPAIDDSIARLWLNTCFDGDAVEGDWPARDPAEAAQLLDRWQADLALPAGVRHRVLSLACRRVASHLRGRSRPRARAWLLQAVRHDASLLLQAGFWSIAADAGVGERAAGTLRSLVQLMPLRRSPPRMRS